MKRLTYAVVLIAFAGSSAALAADIPVRRPPPAPYLLPPVFSWTGIYFGVNGGGAFGQTNWSDPFLGDTGNFHVSGGLIGVTIGGNYQFIGTPFVIGVEGDVDWADIRGTTFTPLGGCDVGCETRSDFLATVRGRAGYAWDRVLFYGTGGVAFGDIQAAAGGLPFDVSAPVGWTVGAGVEYAFLPGWTAKVEYLFVDLGNRACDPASCGGTATTVSLQENIIRGGINFKFW